MKKLMAIVSFILLSSMASYGFAAPADATATADAKAGAFKGGVINMSMVYQKSGFFQGLNTKFVSQFKARQDDLIDAQKKLQDENNQLNTMTVNTSEELTTRNALQQKIYVDKQNLDISNAELQRDVTVARYEMLSTFMARFNTVVGKIATDQHFDLIQQLDNNIFYVNKNVDITQDVISQLGS